MSAVARRAGLTTGALYGRYENVNELAAAVWTARVRDTHFALLDRAVRSLVDGDASVPIVEVITELMAPSRTTMAAARALRDPRRIDELEEVVTPDVESWLKGWGRRRRTRPPAPRPGRVHAGIAVGSPSAHDPHPRPLDWEPVFARIGRSYAQPYTEPATRFVPERMDACAPTSATRRRMPSSTRCARSRHTSVSNRATVSRVPQPPRRSHVRRDIPRYHTKDELLAHAVEVLLAQRFADDLDANMYLFTAPDVGVATAGVIGGYLGSAATTGGSSASKRN